MGTVLAWQNLVHDWVRLVVTLIGVVFAVVLMNTEFGLFLGFAKTTSGLIDHSHADLWIMAPGTQDVDQVAVISERKLYQALAVPGVADGAKLNVEYVFLQKPDGGNEPIVVVGFDPEHGLGVPWNIVAGSINDLRYPNTIMIDELYREKLGIDHLGQIVEISGHRAQVVGFTRGIRSFTQAPYVFTSAKTSLGYTRVREDQTKFVLISVAPDANRDHVKALISQRLADVTVITTEEFSRITQIYWMFTTGAGLALLVGAVMGLAVGVVVVSQTLYATTVDHIAEFGTLRAIGGSNRYIYGVIIRQALLSAGFGYLIGTGIAYLIVIAATNAGPAILLPWWSAIVMLILTIVMCVGAAMISIAKVMKIDPTMVFK
jgi:putative ABC transport system permease protein